MDVKKVIENFRRTKAQLLGDLEYCDFMLSVLESHNETLEKEQKTIKNN